MYDTRNFKICIKKIGHYQIKTFLNNHNAFSQHVSEGGALLLDNHLAKSRIYVDLNTQTERSSLSKSLGL